MKSLAQDDRFLAIMQPSDRVAENQGMIDYVTRYLVFVHVEYNKSWDIEEYLDNGLIRLAGEVDTEVSSMLDGFEKTIELLTEIGESNVLRKYQEGKFQGRVGQAAFETIFLGIAQNIRSISRKPNPSSYVLARVKLMWARDDVREFTRAGLRGTDRIQKTIEFGKIWFAK